MSTTLADLAVYRARAEWEAWARLNREARAAAVARYIQEGCAGQPSAAYLWCGAFAAWAWQAVHPQLRAALWPSTYRLYLLGHYLADRNLWPTTSVAVPGLPAPLPVREWHTNEGALRLVQHPAQAGGRLSWTLEPGDVATVRELRTKGRDGKPGRPLPYGGHVVLVNGVGSAGIETISGNAGPGQLGDGSRGYGVVLATYRPAQLQMAIRLSPLDLRADVVYRRP